MAGGVIRDILTFDQALARHESGRLHVLLGNGFSRAWRDDIFAYDALFDRADFASLSPSAQRAFATLATTDFEVVMRALRHASSLVQLYDPPSSALADQLRSDAVGLREVLVKAIAGSHPDRPHDISADAYARCKRFLAHFGTIYTVNYDLLLYWALMQEDIEPYVPCDDGFRTPEEGPQEYVSWDPWKSFSQNVHYLHGALHIFDSGLEIQKYTWSNTSVALVDQIRDALATNKYPLFVAEGESSQKLKHIKHSDFLSRAHKSFANIGGTLVVYGHSFAENDEHILRRLDGSKVRLLLVGVHGDPESDANVMIRERSQALAAARPAERALEVVYFQTDSVEVW